MRLIDFIHTILLIILVDRSLILRDRYIFAIERQAQSESWKYFAVWIYCKKLQDDHYGRSGGRRLFYFYYKFSKGIRFSKDYLYHKRRGPRIPYGRS